MSGLEMRAQGGRLTYVRQTFSMDEIEKGRDAMTQGYAPRPCTVPPKGWFCTRAEGHEGPCAAYSTAVPSTPMRDRERNLPGVLVAIIAGIAVVGLFAGAIVGIIKLTQWGLGA